MKEEGSSAINAVALALLSFWRSRLGKKHAIDLESLIHFLDAELPKGYTGKKVTDYKVVNGQITDPLFKKNYEMQIAMNEKPDEGNIFVLNLGKIWPERGYKDGDYHAVIQQYVQQMLDGRHYMNAAEPNNIRNCWGDHDNIISMADAQKGIHQRYKTAIKRLTYKPNENEEIPIIWKCNSGELKCIYSRDDRQECLDELPHIEVQFSRLCKDFGLNENGEEKPEDRITALDIDS